ncbi:MAG TPA: ATP-dependent DNA ligase [Acidimicrobiales bacterium]|nr:ATP-dependent DNA ligase [Acidimicrobiales bacterium]
MDLPVLPPLTPMLAKAHDGLPPGEEGDWWFEPKWDGFRVVVFRDGDEVEMLSRSGRDLIRYFPEAVDPLREALPAKAVIDGEIVVPSADGLDFDLLGQRIHPAASRVQMLAEATPSEVVAFDVLALGADDLTGAPLGQRRRALEEALVPGARVHLNQGTFDRVTAQDWFVRFEGAGLDGVIAKPVGSTYEPGARGWVKVKHSRTADVVVAGYRVHKDGEGVGSLLLGLHDDEGRLHSVGVAASFKAADRRALLAELAPLVVPAEDIASHPWGGWTDPAAHAEGRLPGGPSRWNGKKDLSFTPLRPERVAEVAYERVDHGRFRATSKFLRWRPDREPDSCRYDQLEVVPAVELSEVLGRT